MNFILDIIIIAIVVLFFCLGMKKGFARTFIEVVGYLLSFMIAFSVAGYVADYVYEEKVKETIVTSISESVQNKVDNAAKDTTESVDGFISSMPTYIQALYSIGGLDSSEIEKRVSEYSQKTNESITKAANSVCEESTPTRVLPAPNATQVPPNFVPGLELSVLT